jgi:hypothetical protein
MVAIDKLSRERLGTEKVMKRAVTAAVWLAAALVLAACVAGSQESQHAASGGFLSQLLLGLWHGVIAPVTLIVEVINHFAPHLLPWTVRLYETKAAGTAYDVGFYFGLAGSPIIIRTGWSRRRP